MKPIRIKQLGKLLQGLAMMMLVAGCTTAKPREPVFFDRATWDPDIHTIALVEVSYNPRYTPPTDYDLDGDLRTFLGRELERKGYRLVVVGNEWNNNLKTEKPPFDQLAEMAPEGADAALALYVDYLFFSPVLGERNPPPETEIAAEARLVAKDPARELWRDWADATAGGASGWPFSTMIYLRQQAVQELADKLFETLPDAGNSP